MRKFDFHMTNFRLKNLNIVAFLPNLLDGDPSGSEAREYVTIRNLGFDGFKQSLRKGF